MPKFSLLQTWRADVKHLKKLKMKKNLGKNVSLRFHYILPNV